MVSGRSVQIRVCGSTAEKLTGKQIEGNKVESSLVKLYSQTQCGYFTKKVSFSWNWSHPMLHGHGHGHEHGHGYGDTAIFEK